MENQAQCPYCGETVQVLIDEGGGSSQSYVEDCPVCCRPWTVEVHVTASDEAEVFLSRQDD